ncbi:amino acid adenylation domain-containing protein [Micromonospora orduensis]|uniref:Amino acid adenylation domain-containing protein n=1 Tax=Micromonospora orduensis TaxID=1420891 RepID=A0A5C4QV87_9ACTN|nr:amino acid adenylation domain-containing protein [Micromonospora orduensis]TNH29630.1 amino acid adenylation domain-containing protein [Micromonospora orduensis]
MVDPRRRGALIHEAVADHAARRPEATALLHRGGSVDYRTLDAAAAFHAVELAARGVGPGDVVPLLVPRSAQLVALQLAVLKCGAAYACIDPRWPAERQAAILDQLAPVLVASEPGVHRDRCESYPVEHEHLDALAARGCRFEEVDIDPSAAAMVFFTSGTTGRPKGVVSPHRAVTRLFGPAGLPGFGPGHATPQAAPVPWDMYAFELWGQLTTGGTSVLVEGEHLLPGVLRELVRDVGVDTLWLTSSLFNLFVDEDPDCFRGLGQVFTGGEKLSSGHVHRFLLAHPTVPLHNGYGPAENCMLTTTRLIRGADCEVPGGIPVGEPVPGTTVHVLDEAGQRCGTGRPGEICIAGQGLAVGYLNDPGETAARFPTVMLDGAAQRVYRTGDVGLFDDAGCLHFRGRADRQVKISGYRVELAEIEAEALRLPGVRDCTALALSDPNGQVTNLALFYVGDPGEDAPAGPSMSDPQHVLARLREVLPGYLVPRVLRRLDRFPVLANGKRDHISLLSLARRSPRPPLTPGSGRPPRP